MHTSAHILAEVLHHETGALITGNQLGAEESRMDFSLEDFDREKIEEAVRKSNEIIQKNLQIRTHTMKREDALKLPNISKLANADELLPKIPELRIVEIGDFDIQADGGTHVKTTIEVGTIQITQMKNQGKNNRRVYWKLT